MSRNQGKGLAKRPGRYHHGDLRGALIRTALQVVEEQGVEALTLRELARRLKVSHAAPAHHFPDKQALVAALAAEGFRRFTGALEAAAAREPTAEPRLAAIGRGYVHFALDHPGYFRVMFGGSLADLEERSDELAQASAQAFAVLERCVGEVAGDPERVGPAALAAWSFVHGAATLYLDGAMRFPSGARPERPALDAWLDTVVPRLIRGLAT